MESGGDFFRSASLGFQTHPLEKIGVSAFAANRVLIINNDNANAEALSDLLLRTQIEADLAEADNATFVGWYVTPTAQGGHADFVRFIVVDTITKLAGLNGPRANAFLDQADAFTAAGNHKAAYQSLRKAYKAAVGN